MSFKRAMGEINMGVDLWLKRVESVYVDEYRSIVWSVFLRILRQTPQFTGKAVANWNIGVGQPDYSFDSSYGDDPLRIEGDTSSVAPNRRGDSKWIGVAMRRNKPKLPTIQRQTRVYFSNGTMGDDSDKQGTNLYLEALQNPAYWSIKLRSVNKPYETAQESIIAMSERLGRLKGLSFRPGGTNFQDYA